MDKVLIFDLGNVLFPLDYTELHDWLATTVEVYDHNFKRGFDKLYVNYESGDFDTVTFLKHLRDEIGMSFEDEDFYPKWVSLWKRDFEEVHQLLHELKSLGHPLYLLSNTNELHVEAFTSKHPIMGIFDRTFYSHELSLAKPNPDIYFKVQSLLNKPAHELVFFDDKIENVESAKKVGWNAYVFEHAEGLRHILEEDGFL